MVDNIERHIHKLTVLRQRLRGAITANPRWSREQAGAGAWADLLLPGRARMCLFTYMLHLRSTHRFPVSEHGCAWKCACSQEGHTGMGFCCSRGLIPSGCASAGKCVLDVLYCGRALQFSHISTSVVLICTLSSATKRHCAWGRWQQQQLGFPT